MHKPVVGDNWLKGLARKFITFSDSWLIKTILRPIIFLLPPTVLTAVSARQGMMDDLRKILPEQTVNLIDQSAVLILIGAYIYIVIIKAIYALIKSYSKPSRELSLSDILAINKALEIVVTDKYKRMSEEVKSSNKSASICAAKTFKTITKPEQQIALLIASIKRVFEHLDESNALIRVGLLKISDNKPTDWIAFEPISHPPRTEALQLSAPSSTVSASIKRKSIVVIDDIQSELSKSNKNNRNFLTGSTQRGDQGSQICYPVIHASSGKIEYVITVAGNKKACLISKHAELYSWILEQFALRISLEHSLLILKEKANEEQRAA